VDGFLAAGIFDTQGELLARSSLTNGIKPEKISGLTGDLFEKMQRLTTAMGMGNVRFLNILSNGANILMQSAKEVRGDPSPSVAHIVIVLGPDGNTAMGKLRLHSVMREIEVSDRLAEPAREEA